MYILRNIVLSVSYYMYLMFTSSAIHVFVVIFQNSVLLYNILEAKSQALVPHMGHPY